MKVGVRSHEDGCRRDPGQRIGEEGAGRGVRGRVVGAKKGSPGALAEVGHPAGRGDRVTDGDRAVLRVDAPGLDGAGEPVDGAVLDDEGVRRLVALDAISLALPDHYV